MFTIYATPEGFLITLFLFAIGAFGVLPFRKHDTGANLWSSTCAILGSLSAIIFSIGAWSTAQTLTFTIGTSPLSLLSFSFSVDTLSAFFIFVISLISLFCSIYGVGYIKHYYRTYNIALLGFCYNLFIFGMLLVVSASNGLFFLIAWEIMSVASYFLVVYDRKNPENVKAGFLYLVMTHIGTTFITLALFLLYKSTGSFDFEAIRRGAALIPTSIKNVVFILGLIGFGTKAGIIPLHIWLPSAHPAAPSHVSGLMSGVMIKTGIYMMIRVFLGMLTPIPLWWGLTVLILGSISSLLGVLYALTEHDIKRLLAYHSIENIGIILLGLGSALTFTSLNMPALAAIGLIAALFHTLNHATFKSLLFLSAGSVIKETHTGNMEEHGGLIKYMPFTALSFLIGSMAISALPPFNGFFSEWFTFQSLFQGIQITSSLVTMWTFIASAGALAFTGGLALACFVKAFGATFLARPRSEEVKHAKESSFSLRFGMGALALSTIVFGVFSGGVTTALQAIASALIGATDKSPIFIHVSRFEQISTGNFASSSGLVLFMILALVLGFVWFVTKFGIYKNQKIRIGETWDCGTDLKPRMEITSTGFARSIIVIFKNVLRPSLQHNIEYDDSSSRYLPKRTVTLSIHDIYRTYLYNPIQKVVTILSERTKVIQSGNLNMYILYIFVALLAALYIAH